MENNAIAQELFTEEQIKYVNSVKDEDLRFHLLHQVRLRDNMESDRDAFEKLLANKNSITHAIKIITNAIKTDEGYKIGWVANIAMAYIDNEHWYKQKTGKKYLNKKDKHIIANNAAENFIKQLCS